MYTMKNYTECNNCKQMEKGIYQYNMKAKVNYVYYCVEKIIKRTYI